MVYWFQGNRNCGTKLIDVLINKYGAVNYCGYGGNSEGSYYYIDDYNFISKVNKDSKKAHELQTCGIEIKPDDLLKDLCNEATSISKEETETISAENIKATSIIVDVPFYMICDESGGSTCIRYTTYEKAKEEAQLSAEQDLGKFYILVPISKIVPSVKVTEEKSFDESDVPKDFHI